MRIKYEFTVCIKKLYKQKLIILDMNFVFKKSMCIWYHVKAEW